ncbi:putative leucine-rich repeat-containing protein DDB_G0290503 [Trematomus bernacchii]|uniref:putative leucine-rich repeat-containing protein DDB_G0290503 n=1 Tax=Trematomus bernacchii TaxID=40690 RepID=UPI00146F2B6D|nr:putative leucine-rich repeat-containing protein DDB_G0290503 [Trematomus bernacchii]
MFGSAHTDVVQGHNNGKHLAMSPKSLLQPLDQVLLSAEEKLKKRSLALKQVSTSKALEELMGLQTQARLEKEEMEAKINQMEEDFNKEKTTWSDLSCQRLEEISSLGTELLDAQSHIDHLKEENAKLTMKDDSTSEAFKELMGLQTLAKTEMEAKVNQMEEDFNKEKTTWSDLSCQRLEEISSLGTELLDAQSHIDHLKEENAKLTMKDDSTSEDLKELMGLQTQAKMEKEEMEAKINQMEEDFNKEKTTWSDLSCQRLEEISSLGTELSDAQSHIDHLKEENAKLTIKDDSTSEAFEELKGLQTQAKMEKEEMEAKISDIEEDFKKEKTSLRMELSDAQSHIDHLKEENAKLTIKDDSTSEDLKELMGLQTQAKMEKEEMEAKINQMEEDFNKEKTTWSDLSCQRLEEISSLGTELSDAQSHIDHLKEENAKLTIKDDSTSEAFEELMDLQTQANEEKEEMEAKINEMEEDFKKEKTTWSDLSCQRLEEISSLGTELSDAQSHIDHLKEENAKLTIKDDSTSEAFKELKGLQTQAKMEKEEMEAKINDIEEDFKKEKTSLRMELSDAQSHIDHLKEENAKLTIKDDSTSEHLKELMGLQTQAKMEKEEMEAKINEMEEDFKKEKTTWSDLSCQRLEEISSLGTELSDAQSHIDHLKEENVKLTIKDDSTSEAFEELMDLQTQANEEKEEMEAKINEMEEDFNKEKTTWSDLSCQRLEEISSLGTELSDAQSHIDHLKEENAKLTMKDDSTSEAFKELMDLQTQANEEKEEMEAKINEMEEDFNKEKTTWSDLSCQRLEEISSLGTELSVAQSHIDHLKEENAKLTMKDDGTSEALEELMGLQTQAKMEKEEMVAKLNEMEEDFNKEKTTWSELSCQRLGEISSLGTELSDAQSHIDHLNEENAKLTMKEDSTSESLEELLGLQTQAKTEKEEMESKINEIEEDLKKEKTSSRTELSDAQSHIDHQKEENAKLNMNDDSTSEAFKDLMGLQTQAKMEKEEMAAKINEMEEDFEKDKTSLKMELSDAHSNIDHLKEELLDSRRQAEREITSLQESFSIQIQESSARISATVDHWREVIRGTEEEAATTLRESKEAWQGRFKQLEENIESKGGLISSLIDKMRASADSHRQTLNLLSRNRSELCESQKSVESKHDALEETYQTELTEKENSCQRRVAEMVSRNELERLLLQKEAECMRRTSALEEEIQRLIREKRQLQV